MNELNLKNLFARVARKPLDVPDADSVMELSRLPHAEEAASALCADLVRLSRELEPVSEQLSTDIAAAFGQTSAATHRRAVPRRAVSARRGWRIAVASTMAASLVVAVALIASHRGRVPAPTSASATVPDRIFAGFDERNMAAGKAVHGDEIFRANFLPDEIFSSSRPHEG
ncbi:MAG: hypothetical protein JSS13_00880 [Proteobacteria bacterium]|nr:hypothetical protein [Pseudomonadota bacterium]